LIGMVGSMDRITCPKCGSYDIKELSGSYPHEFECRNCRLVFLESGNAAIDE
jgi:transposase-like protein